MKITRRTAIASLLGALLAGAPSPAQDSGEAEPDPYPYDIVVRDAVYGHLMEGPFREPGGVCFDPVAGELLVADMKNALIGIFDQRCVPLFAFGGSALLNEPTNVEVTADGSIYVLDAERFQVKAFNYRGERRPPVEFSYPATDEREAGQARIGAFTIDRQGKWYVCDADVPQVLVYDKDLVLEMVLPTERGGGAFGTITGIGVSGDGRIAVVDYRATPVQVFDPSGKLVAAFGEREPGIQNFTVPVAVEFDAEGFLYVVDLLRHDVKIFDSAGAFQGIFGGWYSPATRGRGPGELLYPLDIALEPQGRIYVAERFGNRVQVFERVPKGEEEGRPRLRIPEVSDDGR